MLNQAFASLLPKLALSEHPSAPIILSALQSPPSTPSGTMKKWLQARHGRLVHTVQFHKSDQTTWVPLNRTVDSESRVTGVYFDHSLRDYVGMRVLSVTSMVLLVEDEFTVIAYIESEAN